MAELRKEMLGDKLGKVDSAWRSGSAKRPAELVFSQTSEEVALPCGMQSWTLA